MATDIQLVGTKGVSAWLVYNEVIFNLPFIERNSLKRRAFNDELILASFLEEPEELRNFILGLTVDKLPVSKSRVECLAEFKAMDHAEKQEVFAELLMNVDLTEDKITRLLSVQKDANGIPYTKANIANLKASDIIPLVIDTLMACSEAYFDMSLVSVKQIEALQGSMIDVRESIAEVLSVSPTLEAGEVLSLAATKAMRGIHVD